MRLFADTILPANWEDVAGDDGIVDDAEEVVFEINENVLEAYPILGQFQVEARRKAIEYVFVSILGSPPEDQWDELSVINLIMSQLCIPSGSVVHDEFLRTGRRRDEWKWSKVMEIAKSSPGSFNARKI